MLFSLILPRWGFCPMHRAILATQTPRVEKQIPFPQSEAPKDGCQSPDRAASIKHFTFHWVCLLQAVLHPHLLVCPLLPCYILKRKSSQHWTQVTECASTLKPPQVCSSTIQVHVNHHRSAPVQYICWLHRPRTRSSCSMHGGRRLAITFLDLVPWSCRNQMSGPHLLTLRGLVPAGTRCLVIPLSDPPSILFRTSPCCSAIAHLQYWSGTSLVIKFHIS